MAGTKDKLAGKAKQFEGKLTGDKARETQGKEQERRGRAKARTSKLLREDKEKLERAEGGGKPLTLLLTPGNGTRRAPSSS